MMGKQRENEIMKFIDGVNYVSDVMGFPAIIPWIFIAITLILLGALLLDALFGSVILIDCEAKYKKAAKPLFCIATSLLGIFWFVIFIIALLDPFNIKEPTGEYKVSISSDVNMEEFRLSNMTIMIGLLP